MIPNQYPKWHMFIGYFVDFFHKYWKYEVINLSLTMWDDLQLRDFPQNWNISGISKDIHVYPHTLQDFSIHLNMYLCHFVSDQLSCFTKLKLKFMLLQLLTNIMVLHLNALYSWMKPSILIHFNETLVITS